MTDEMPVLPGERCRIAREQQGMTEAEAAQRLHLSVTYLKSLEADDYERLPEATFVKGYLRNYARLLGLPADEVANTFEQMVKEDAREKQLSLPTLNPQPPAWRKPLLVVLALLLAALLAWHLWPAQQPPATLAPLPGDGAGAPADNETMKPEGQSEAPAYEELGSLSESEEGDSAMQTDNTLQAGETAPLTSEEQQPATTEETDTAALASAEEPAESDTEQAETEESVTTAETAEQEPIPSGMDRLAMGFSAPCWVKVTDNNGRVLQQGEQAPGTSVKLDGEAPFRLIIGDAGAVTEVTVNGEVVTLPTTASGSVVRVTLP